MMRNPVLNALFLTVAILVLWSGLTPVAAQTDQPAEGQPVVAPAAESPVLAQVGNRKFTEADLQAKIEEVPTYARKNFYTKDGKLKLLDNLIKSEMLYQAAIDAGYDKRPDIQVKLKDAEQRILQSEYFNNEIKDKGAASEADLLKYYEDHKADYVKPARAKVSHIQTATEEEARKAYDTIKGGKEFGEVAKEVSNDTGSNNQGGDLGWITKDGFIRNIGRSEEFEAAAFALKPGEISQPVKTLKSWHIIKMDEFEAESVQPFNDVKAQIANEISVTDAAILKEYEENKDTYTTRARVKAQHIQLNTEDDAKAALEQLNTGAEFETVAQEKSEDKATAKTGGDLGYIYRDGYIRGIGKDTNFENAVFELKVGEVSGIIKSEKGFHIVKVTEKEDARLKELGEVRSQIKNKLMRNSKEGAIESAFDELKQKYNVKVFEDLVTDSPGAEAIEDGQETVMP